MSLSDLTPNQLAQTPAGVPPPGVIPNLEDPPSTGHLLFVIGGVGVAIMLVVAALRFYTQIVIRKVFRAEDWSALIGGVGAVGYYIICIFAVMHGKFGTHSWDMSIAQATSNAFIIVSPGPTKFPASTHLHLHTSTWGSTPQTLSPTRFLHEPQLKNTVAYRPFGAGRHVCPGRYLARKAVFAFVACLLGGFEVVEKRVVSKSNSQSKGVGKAGGAGAGGFAAMPEMDMSKPTPGIASIGRGWDVVLRLLRR